MKRNGRKKLYHWFCILLLGALISGCGHGERAASDVLGVNLELPAGESELFWYGVETRKISVAREGKILQETAWNQGQILSCDLKAGDELIFTGLDGAGRTLVTGTVRVGEEKKVSIPLRRIL